MEIRVTAKLRENQHLLDQNIFIVDATLETDIPSDEIKGIAWTIHSEESNALHSGNATEDAFLNYSNPYNPTIEITTPSGGVCNVYVEVLIQVEVVKELEVVKLVNETTVKKTQEMQKIIESHRVESEKILLCAHEI